MIGKSEPPGLPIRHKGCRQVLVIGKKKQSELGGKTMLSFRECTLEQLDEMFDLTPLPLKRMPVLQAWLDGQNDISEQERG